MSERPTVSPHRRARASQPAFRRWWLLFALAPLFAGCSALHPVQGVPAVYLPHQYEGPSRGHKRTIDLSLLVQTPPDQHRVAAGDILSIYVPRVLGRQPTEVNEVGIDPPINMPMALEDSPTVGFPIQVRDDNTISLPQIPPLNVRDMTLHEVEEAIRRAYTVDHRILRPEEALVMVSLQRPRVHRVLVVRQETSNELSSGNAAGTINIGASKRGTARTVTLKAYENDVLHALALAEGADGLPGLDAENTIYIIRRRKPEVRGLPPIGPPPSIDPHLPHGLPAPHSGLAAPATGVVQAGFQQAAPVRSPEHQGHWPPGRTGSDPGAAQPFGSYRSSHARNASGIVLASHATQEFNPAPSAGAVSGFPAPPMHGHSLGLPAPPTMMPVQPQTLEPIPAARSDSHWMSALQHFDPTIDNPNVIKIPIRLAPGEIPYFTEDQIKLYDGDIVFIESRETEVFYTGGLLGGGQFTLPRDYDLRLLEAISIAEGRMVAGADLNRSIGGVSALNRDVANSASRVAILRTLPNGQRITIEVDLHKAMKYQEENILIQPGDMLILQYTPLEAVCAFTQRFLLEGALIGIAATAFTGGGN